MAYCKNKRIFTHLLPPLPNGLTQHKNIRWGEMKTLLGNNLENYISPILLRTDRHT